MMEKLDAFRRVASDLLQIRIIQSLWTLSRDMGLHDCASLVVGGCRCVYNILSGTTTNGDQRKRQNWSSRVN